MSLAPSTTSTSTSSQTSITSSSTSSATSSASSISPSSSSQSSYSATSSSSTTTLVTETSSISEGTTTSYSISTSSADTSLSTSSILTSSSSQSSYPTTFSSSSATTLAAAETSFTLGNTPFSTSTSSADGSTSTFTSSGDNLSNPQTTSFWKNRSAVAGTFVIVGLATLGLAALILIAYKSRRRRQGRRESAMEEEDWGTSDISPTPSMAPATTPARADAFASREIHYGSSYMSDAGQAAYDLDRSPARLDPDAPNIGVGANAHVQFQVLKPLRASTLSTSAIEDTSINRLIDRHPRCEKTDSRCSEDSFYGGNDPSYGQAV